MPISDANYDTRNIIGLCVVGLIIKYFFGTSYSADGSNGPASSALWGYGLATISIFFLMFVQTQKYLEANSSKKGINLDTITHFWNAILNILPPFIMFVILSWSVLLNYQYYTKINTGQVSIEYQKFSNMSTIMILFQMIVLFKYIYSDSDITNTEKNKLGAVTYMLGLLNVIFLFMMNIIVIYFSTDG